MSKSFLSPTFVIGYIRIGSVEGASCVNLGNNYPTGFESHSKLNQGFGNVSGDNNDIRGATSAVDDNDVLDMLSEADSDMPQWVKHMLQQAAGSS